MHISADSLLVDNGKNVAEFRGNVRVTQGDMVMTADEIKVLYQGNATGGGRIKADESALKRIIAQGHVSLVLDDRTALADQAVYHAENQVLVLSGKRPKVMMGENWVAGTKITFYRIDGRIEVEGNGKRRVEGLFFNDKVVRKPSKNAEPAP